MSLHEVQTNSPLRSMAFVNVMFLAPIKILQDNAIQQTLQAKSRIYVELPLPSSNMMTITLNATMGEVGLSILVPLVMTVLMSICA